MAIITEMNIPADTFDLGRVTSVGGPVHLELERVVPAGGEVMPFFWATNCPDFDRFESRVREEELVEELSAVVRFEDQVLYHVVWGETTASLSRALVESEAAILEAHGNDPWQFRLRFATRERLQHFVNHCREAGIEVEPTSINELDRGGSSATAYGLTHEQRAALLAAVRGGYFGVPRETTLAEVAAELGISQQATSERLRRGSDRVFRRVLALEEE